MGGEGTQQEGLVPALLRVPGLVERIPYSCQGKAGFDLVPPPKRPHRVLEHHMCFHHVGEVLGSIPHKTQNYYKREHEKQIQQDLVSGFSLQPFYEELPLRIRAPPGRSGPGAAACCSAANGATRDGARCCWCWWDLRGYFLDVPAPKPSTPGRFHPPPTLISRFLTPCAGREQCGR